MVANEEKSPILILEEHVVDIRYEADLAAEAHQFEYRRWSRLSVWLVLTAAILATLAGATAFASLVDRKIVGITALISALLSAIASRLGADKRASAHRVAATTYSLLAETASDILVQIRLLAGSAAIQDDVRRALETQVDRLRKQRNQAITQVNWPASEKATARAQQLIPKARPARETSSGGGGGGGGRGRRRYPK
jgi:hypothetical protein